MKWITNMKYTLEIVDSGEVMHFKQGDIPMVLVQEHELSDEQVKYIKEQLALGRKVPLYSTTKAKAKYGDCKIGNIRKLYITVK